MRLRHSRGIYDPTAAKVAADTVAKMVEKITALQPGATDFTTARQFRSHDRRQGRARADRKKELEILWSDYFKPEHLGSSEAARHVLEGGEALLEEQAERRRGRGR